MKVSYTNRFNKALDKIRDKKLLSEIAFVIAETKLAEDIRKIPNLKKLTGHKTYFRIKIGDYRIGVSIENHTVIFADFAHRKDIYKRFP